MGEQRISVGIISISDVLKIYWPIFKFFRFLSTGSEDNMADIGERGMNPDHLRKTSLHHSGAPQPFRESY
jgi:hypothetical protein